MAQASILRALAERPMTARELADATLDHTGSVARYMSKLIETGRAKRIDGASGRGKKAVYAIAIDDALATQVKP